MTKQDPQLEVAVLSEKGRREENQDWMSWSRVPWGELFIVADGMGGHKGGAIAARMTVEGLEKHLKDLPAEWPFVKAFQEAVRRTNEDVYRSAHSGNPETEKMGSTVVAALISSGRVQVGHIGDSRAYLFRNGKLRPLTKDHTTVQRMLDAGMITAEEAWKHPEAHILSRAVGSKPEVEIEIGEPVILDEGDALMLCSDGLSGYIDDQQIEKVLGSQSGVQSIPHDLADLALKASGDDNITVQFIRYGEAVPVTDTGRITAKMPVPQPSLATVIRDALQQLPRNRMAWAVAGVALILSGAVVAVILNPSWNPFRAPSTPVPAPRPTIELAANPREIKSGQDVTLQWKAQNADKVRIEPDIGEVPSIGSLVVAPTKSVSYEITATGPGGLQSAKAVITVIPAPVIEITAKPPVIEVGRAALLTWKVQNASTVSIDPDLGEVNSTGSKEVTPQKSLSYLIKATGPGGFQTTTVAITVKSPTVPATVPPTSKNIEAKEQATEPSFTTKAANTVDASKEPIPVLILAHEKDLARAEAIKKHIEVSHPKTSVSKYEDSLPPGDRIFYPDEDLLKSAKDLARVLKTEKGFEEIDRHCVRYDKGSALQGFVEEKLSGQKRHLLIVLPPRRQ